MKKLFLIFLFFTSIKTNIFSKNIYQKILECCLKWRNNSREAIPPDIDLPAPNLANIRIAAQILENRLIKDSKDNEAALKQIAEVTKINQKELIELFNKIIKKANQPSVLIKYKSDYSKKNEPPYDFCVIENGEIRLANLDDIHEFKKIYEIIL